MTTAANEIRQVALVVRDAQATMRYMTEVLGIGPFYVVPNLTFDHYVYRGDAQAEAPVVSLCFAQAGSVQIELIEQHNTAPSAYTEFLDSGKEGCQHIARWLSDSAEYDRQRQDLLERGLTLVHEGGEAARFAYFATDLPGGLMIELAEAMLPNVRGMFDLVAAASQDWDGSDPIRHF